MTDSPPGTISYRDAYTVGHTVLVTDTHPLNPAVRRDANGIWGGIELPVTAWETSEERVVLSPELQELLQFASPVLRWSREKYQAAIATHSRDIHVINGLADRLTSWRYIGREAVNPDLRRVLLRDETGRWYAVTLGNLLGSENVVTVFGSRRANFLANRLDGLIDVMERGDE